MRRRGDRTADGNRYRDRSIRPESRFRFGTDSGTSMKINCLGGGPGSLYFAILMKKSFPGCADRDLRAEPPRRHFRLRRRLLGPDDGGLPRGRRADPRGDHPVVRALGRYRHPHQGPGAEIHRPRLRRHVPGQDAAADAGPLPGTRNRHAFRGADRRPGIPAGLRPALCRGRRQLGRPRPLGGPVPADSSISGPTASSGWAPISTSRPSPSILSKTGTASGGRTAIATSRTCRR